MTYPGGYITAYVVVLYGSRSATGTVTLQADELHEVGWFSETEAAELDLPPDMRLMIPDAVRWLRRGNASDR